MWIRREQLRSLKSGVPGDVESTRSGCLSSPTFLRPGRLVSDGWGVKGSQSIQRGKERLRAGGSVNSGSRTSLVGANAASAVHE